MTSILDPNRFRFDRSPYERPNFKYRCGRGAAWGKPCGRGPNVDGTCGGTAECAPIKNQNGRFECRRPAIAGGPCSDGPLPDGTCAKRQPPCTPRRSLRGIRGRLGVLALGLVLALILGLSGISKGRISSWNPGQLTAGHAGFIAAGDCAACHAAHNSGPTNWIAAVFNDADMTGTCVECHVFDGPARQAHNRINPERPDIGKTTCQMCHTEHKGEFADIVEISDVQCAACHKTSFTSFSSSHPAFPKSFPYFSRTAIKFDHASHFAKYFSDARFTERAPETCLACHSENPNKRSLVRSGFEETCAACHGSQMARRELVLLRLPEFVENMIDEDSVIEACGIMSDEFGALTPATLIEEALLEWDNSIALGGKNLQVATISNALIAELVAGLTGSGVTLAAVSDDPLIAGLTSGLIGAVDLLVTHEDKIDPNSSVILRDDAGATPEVFRDGDYMVIEIPEAPYDRFIVIDYFMSDGQVLHMYPDAAANDNFVAARKSLTLGVPETGQQAWQIGPPYGDDLLVVVATDQRLYDDIRSMVEQTPGYLAFLEQKLSDAEAGGTVAIQYRVVSTAKDDAAAAAIIAERRENEKQLAEERRLAEEARVAEEARLAQAAVEAEAARVAEERRLAEAAAEAEAEDAEDDIAEDEEEDLAEDEDEEEFESVSTEESSVIGAFLLDVVADDPDEYTEPMQELILAMAEGGLEPLAEMIDDRADQSVSTKLLAGLNPETVKQLACAWAANLEYELPAEATMGGWYGDYLELRYRPQSHGDNVAKAWIDFGIAAGRATEEDESGERAIAFRDAMIDPKEGVGGCIKCHAVTAAEDDENDLVVEWRAREVTQSTRNFDFSHGIHLRLLDAKGARISDSQTGCQRCHVLDSKADFASGFTDFDPHSYMSNFKAITKETCTDCHSQGNVREGCQLCHDYHRAPSFNIRISRN